MILYVSAKLPSKLRQQKAPYNDENFKMIAAIAG